MANLGASLRKSASKLDFVVRKAGQPVTDLSPYLGALGHLAAFRAGDLAFLHVHPLPSDAKGPEVAFHADFPSPGRYRLFLEFLHGGQVRLASFSYYAKEGPAATAGHASEHP